MILASAGLVARWAKLYADHKAVSGGVLFVHLSGILLGGGLAIAADRDVLRSSSANLASLGAVHRWVIFGLGLTFVSGLGQLFADLDTYLPSLVFWTKMALIALLIGNGALRL